ncbi:MAG: hypothetical protein H6704_09980 [Myxococcales bacterium]|nr:hypothetical protein [Myxococcales bacterium]
MDMSLRFASILMVTSIQGLGNSNAVRDAHAVEGGVLRDGRQRFITITVPKTSAVTVQEPEEEGEVRFRLSPGLARAVAMKIYEIAAKMWTLS